MDLNSKRNLKSAKVSLDLTLRFPTLRSIRSPVIRQDAVFFIRRVHTSVQNLNPKIIFSNDELHIILKRRNLEICKHSSFFKLLTKFVNIPLNILLFNNWKKSNAWRFLNSYALKWYEVRGLKNYLGGQILYKSVDPPIKNGVQVKFLRLIRLPLQL